MRQLVLLFLVLPTLLSAEGEVSVAGAIRTDCVPCFEKDGWGPQGMSLLMSLETVGELQVPCTDSASFTCQVRYGEGNELILFEIRPCRVLNLNLGLSRKLFSFLGFTGWLGLGGEWNQQSLSRPCHQWRFFGHTQEEETPGRCVTRWASGYAGLRLGGSFLRIITMEIGLRGGVGGCHLGLRSYGGGQKLYETRPATGVVGHASLGARLLFGLELSLRADGGMRKALGRNAWIFGSMGLGLACSF